MNPKKKALIVSFSDLSKDPRVYRQIIALKDYFDISTAGIKAPPKDIAAGEFFDISSKPSSIFFRIILVLALKLRFYNWAYWNLGKIRHAKQALGPGKFDLIIANDLDTLPLCLNIKQNAILYYDAHEYTPEEQAHSFLWRFLYQDFYTYLCRHFMPKADKVFTVGKEIARKYSTTFGVDVNVIMNCPFYADLKPGQVDPNNIKMIHHGGAIRSRHLELMIDVMDFTEQRFSLDLMLIPSNQLYLKQLKEKAAHNPRIRFLQPVPMPEIPYFCNKYDIGLYPLKPSNLNEEYALPNKFFEFIQARLAVITGPSKEMASISEDEGVGRFSSTFKAMDIADVINGLSVSDILKMKNKANLIAKKYSAESQTSSLIARWKI